MFVWSDNSIRWLSNAADYSQYYSKLAARIARHLPPGSHICDMGCGLGFLAEELSKYADHVTAIDVNAKAISVLEKKKLCKVAVICGDALTHTPQVPYDAAVFCYFGENTQILSQMERNIAKKFIIIGSETSEHYYKIKDTPGRKQTIESLIKELNMHNIAYEHEVFILEFGQPLVSMKDAVAFLRHYGGYDDPSQITQEMVEPYLARLEDPEFQYYIKASKNTGMAVISTECGREDRNIV